MHPAAWPTTIRGLAGCLKGEVAQSELRERHGLVSDVGTTSLEGASNRNPIMGRDS